MGFPLSPSLSFSPSRAPPQEENLLKNLRQRDMFARYCLQLEFLHFKKRGHVLARAIRDWAVRNAQHAQEVAAAYSQMVSLANNFPAEF